MAYEIATLIDSTRSAGADLSAAQYKFVKRSGANVILCAAATDVPFGILQNAPASGETAEVMRLGISKCSADAAVAIGNLIGTSADGQGDPKTAGTDTTEYVVGIADSAVSNAGEIFTCAVNCLNPHRAA